MEFHSRKEAARNRIAPVIVTMKVSVPFVFKIGASFSPCAESAYYTVRSDPIKPECEYYSTVYHICRGGEGTGG
jgi:hypothetical protein